MAFDEKAWREKLEQAKTGQELIDLLMEIPDDLPSRIPDNPLHTPNAQKPPIPDSPSSPPTGTTPAG